ncbi:AMP-binding protein [Paenibacillus lentus]|uniref:Acyl-CoA synthetase n=1 Tax=Paenibacillus lentus TaxID=1338368 RepID=A0A3Q8SCG5_9BACL|nr:AMP-binding protein [Paenibacillus lentus]AZK47450.1 hypothetical protein EIM92_15885 [Paenibacillus lentus]
MLITDVIQAHAASHPDKIALIIDNTRKTYKELYCGIKMAAHVLLDYEDELNDDRDTIVGFLLNNSVEFIQYFLAATKIGLCSALFDPKWTDVNIEAIIRQCQPAILIVDFDILPRLTNIPHTAKLIVIDSDASAHSPMIAKYNVTADWISSEPHRFSTSESLFYMGFTSGTTGLPKGFVRAQRSWIESFTRAKEAFCLADNDHVLGTGPLVHSLTIYAAIQTLYLGGTFYLSRKFRAELAIETLESNPITHIYLVPTIFEAIYHAAISRSYKFTSTTVRSLITTGDKWTPESKQKVNQIFSKAGIYEFYGASELSFVTVLDPVGNEQKPSSVGKPFSGVEVSIRKPDGEEAGEGEVGQVYIKSGMIFSGYFENEEETKQVIQGEWATVGDLAMRDADGFLYMVGRNKNMIISGGLNIYPEEIEKVLLKQEEIAETVVVGVPDAYWGQKVVALIQFQEGAVLADQDIFALCRKQLASYKCPKEIIRVHSFPYTTSGKISRTKIIDWLAGRGV